MAQEGQVCFFRQPVTAAAAGPLWVQDGNPSSQKGRKRLAFSWLILSWSTPVPCGLSLKPHVCLSPLSTLICLLFLNLLTESKAFSSYLCSFPTAHPLPELPDTHVCLLPLQWALKQRRIWSPKLANGAGWVGRETISTVSTEDWMWVFCSRPSRLECQQQMWPGCQVLCTGTIPR